MAVIATWTGHTATAMQRALRLTNEAFAERLGVAVRTVANWHARPGTVLSPDLQQAMDTLHQRAGEDVHERFDRMVGPEPSTDAPQPAPIRSEFTPAILQTLDWLDSEARLPAGTSERAVRQQLQLAGELLARGRGTRHGGAGRDKVAEAVRRLYGSLPGGASLYAVTVDKARLDTTMLVRPDWLRPGIPLGQGQEHFEIVDARAGEPALDAEAHAAAVGRVAEIVASGTRYFDSELYNLRRIDVTEDSLSGQFSLGTFHEYALTSDLISSELLDALAGGGAPAFDGLPLRRRYLPSIEAALDSQQRAAGGGILSLFAVARPSHGHDRPADYLLLVQARSRQVVNANGELAVIPKAFHQPMVNATEDARPSATLSREFEEELLGRTELESDALGVGDPSHPSCQTEPMRWLTYHPDRGTWQMDFTGFGINLLTGNYEFAALTAIHDEHWWSQFGGQVVANWEASHLREYSSRDPAALRRLIRDDRWTNEGLFALIRGLKRLAEIAPDRTDLPDIMEER